MKGPLVRWTTRYRSREYLATSLWVVPMVATIGGYLFAVLIVELDLRYDINTPDYDTSTAITVLTAMFSGVITFIGFVITIVLLVPQFAASQFSPRILAIWYRRSPIQFALGFFFFTAAYIFAVLGRVHGRYAPEFSITLAVILVFSGFIIFLWFMSVFANALRPASLSEIVAAYGRDVIARTYPQPFSPGDAPAAVALSETLEGDPVATLTNDAAGHYILGVDRNGLVDLARRHDGVITLSYAVGEYVRSGAVLMEANTRLTPRRRELRQLLVLGTERSLQQDPGYALRILVDVVLKGLSAAINDPTSAVQAMDRISDLLHLIVLRDLGDGYLRDAQGQVRVRYPVWTWEDYLHLGTREIIYYGRDSVQVMRRLRAILLGLEEHAPPERRETIRAELALLDRGISRGFPDAEERAAAREADYQGLGIGHDVKGNASYRPSKPVSPPASRAGEGT